MPPMNSELDMLVKKRAQLDARIQNIKAKKTTQQRKDDTRRKILVGSYILDKHQKADTVEELVRELDTFLAKPNDRALFDLPPREVKSQQSVKPDTLKETS